MKAILPEKPPVQLSVVIPAHHEAPNLKWLLPSLVGTLRQSDITYEVIVADDHSSDDTLLFLDVVPRKDR